MKIIINLLDISKNCNKEMKNLDNKLITCIISNSQKEGRETQKRRI